MLAGKAPSPQEWDLHLSAANDMLLKCSLLIAPWTLVPARDSLYAQVTVLEALVGALAEAFNQQPRDPFKSAHGKRKKKRKNTKK